MITLSKLAIDNKTLWVICQNDSRPHGGSGENRLYLHSDNVWRSGCYNEFKQLTAGYPARWDAELRLSRSGYTNCLVHENLYEKWSEENIHQIKEPKLSLYYGPLNTAFISEVKLLQVSNPDFNSCVGDWFITCEDPNISKSSLMIHSDGKVYSSAKNEYWQYTAYLKSKEDALKILKGMGVTQYREFFPGWWDICYI